MEELHVITTCRPCHYNFVRYISHRHPCKSQTYALKTFIATAFPLSSQVRLRLNLSRILIDACALEISIPEVLPNQWTRMRVKCLLPTYSQVQWRPQVLARTIESSTILYISVQEISLPQYCLVRVITDPLDSKWQQITHLKHQTSHTFIRRCTSLQDRSSQATVSMPQ
jgi:hypothetical protein